MTGRSRREILQAGAVALTAGLAGCSGGDDDPTPSERSTPTPDPEPGVSRNTLRLAEIQAANHDTEQAHTVRLLIRDRSGDIVYWRAQQLDPAPTQGRVNSSQFEGLPGGTGAYELIVRLDDGAAGTWKRIDTTSLSVPCLSLSIDVKDPDEKEDLSLYNAIEPDCDTES